MNFYSCLFTIGLSLAAGSLLALPIQRNEMSWTVFSKMPFLCNQVTESAKVSSFADGECVCKSGVWWEVGKQHDTEWRKYCGYPAFTGTYQEPFKPCVWDDELDYCKKPRKK